MLSESVDVLPGVHDGRLEFSTSMRLDRESGLVAAVGVVNWRYYEGALIDDFYDDCEWVDGEELARAEVWGYDGMMSSFDDTDVVLANFLYACDVVSEDLYVAAKHVRSAYDGGELAKIEESCLTQRWLILDNVFVVEKVRGFGIGGAVAAHTLEMAGAWSDGVAIVSVAGAHLDRNKWPSTLSDKQQVEYAEAWGVQRERSAKLLESLGLNCLSNGIHFGHTSFVGSFTADRYKSFRLNGGLPWVS